MDLLKQTLITTTISDSFLTAQNITLDVLRLDLIHPEVSGNKWFKLKYNIQAALDQHAESILSFGGAYSNHLHALAFAGKLFGIKTIGIIRGEDVMNATLTDCIDWGMELHFISRSEYRTKHEDEFIEMIQRKFPSSLVVPEGGNNESGRKGCEEIMQGINLEKYSHLCCAVGTGATFTGIIASSSKTNHVLGFSAIKNGLYLEDEIRKHTTKENWTMLHSYHFGGFAKRNNELIFFVQQFKAKHHLELDYVYTGKMMFGLYDLIQKKSIPSGSTILFIHSGGLQGNRSLQQEWLK